MTFTAAAHFKPRFPLNSARLFRISRLFCTLAFCAAAVAARAEEPAEGVYSCGNTDKEWVYVMDLEVKGKTYREFKEGVAPDKRGKFLPFTTDGKNQITWSERFSFLSHVGSVSASSYRASPDPTIVINYSDHKRNPVLMVCSQADSKNQKTKETPSESPKEKK